MKRLLLLIPLLAACAPSLSMNSTPFLPGQTWVVSSHSALDPKMPASTTFTVQSVKASQDGNWIITTKGAVRAGYTSNQRAGSSGTVLIFDTEPIIAGARHMRVCMLPVRTGSPSYSGAATHPTPEVLDLDHSAQDPAFKEALDYVRQQQGSADPAMLASQAYVRFVDSSDLSSCTLVRQN